MLYRNNILMAATPKECVNIINKKTKYIALPGTTADFPTYPHWVYIYCSTEGSLVIQYDDEATCKYAVEHNLVGDAMRAHQVYKAYDRPRYIKHPNNLSGYVIGRFWCKGVEEFEFDTTGRDDFDYWFHDGMRFDHKKTHITYEQLFDRIGAETGVLMEITHLEIFEAPQLLADCNYVKPEDEEKLLKSDSVRLHSVEVPPESFMKIVTCVDLYGDDLKKWEIDSIMEYLYDQYQDGRNN